MNQQQYQKSITNRHLKISALIRNEISIILSKDDMVGMHLGNILFTVFYVKTSMDLKKCSIFIKSLNTNLDRELIATLNTFAPRYRKKLGDKVKLKSLPYISFVIYKDITNIN